MELNKSKIMMGNSGRNNIDWASENGPSWHKIHKMLNILGSLYTISFMLVAKINVTH